MHNPIDILVVDDDRPIVDLLTEVLVDEGYSVRSTMQGAEVLALVRLVRPALLLIDLYMPGMNGIEVLNQLQSTGFADIPAVLITASSDKATGMAQLAGRAYLLKPFDIADLLACVAQYMRPPQPHESAQQQQTTMPPPYDRGMAADDARAIARTAATHMPLGAGSGRSGRRWRTRMLRRAARREPQRLWAWRSIAAPRRRLSRQIRAIPARPVSAPPIAVFDGRDAPRLPEALPSMASAAERVRLHAQTAALLGTLAEQCDRASAACRHAAQLVEASAQTCRQAAEVHVQVAQTLRRSAEKRSSAGLLLV